MFRTNKLIKSFILLLLFPLSLFYLYKSKNNKFFNNLYFNSPILIINKKECKNYDNLIKDQLDDSFSVSIIDDNGFLIAKLNDRKLVKPASNLKLISTAYVISKMKLSDNIYTYIYRDKFDNYHIKGNGDPDLTFYDIQKLLSKINAKKQLTIYLYEVNSRFKWPYGWTSFDKIYPYGSPITSLAINSNANKYSDISNLGEKIKFFLNEKYPDKNVTVNIKDYDSFKINSKDIVDSIRSNSILSLLTLANAESHNFTSESLFKNASNSWNRDKYNEIIDWMKYRGFPVKDINISDASGLSRNNKITTNLIASFLHKMKFHSEFIDYSSSLSILGLRGTLSNRYKNTEIEGKFFGKTGTLSNAYALSGYLYKGNKSLSISIIQNSNKTNPNKIFRFLSELYKIEKCD